MAAEPVRAIVLTLTCERCTTIQEFAARHRFDRKRGVWLAAPECLAAREGRAASDA